MMNLFYIFLGIIVVATLVIVVNVQHKKMKKKYIAHPQIIILVIVGIGLLFGLYQITIIETNLKSQNWKLESIVEQLDMLSEDNEYLSENMNDKYEELQITFESFEGDDFWFNVEFFAYTLYQHDSYILVKSIDGYEFFDAQELDFQISSSIKLEKDSDVKVYFITESTSEKQAVLLFEGTPYELMGSRFDFESVDIKYDDLSLDITIPMNYEFLGNEFVDITKIEVYIFDSQLNEQVTITIDDFIVRDLKGDEKLLVFSLDTIYNLDNSDVVIVTVFDDVGLYYGFDIEIK